MLGKVGEILGFSAKFKPKYIEYRYGRYREVGFSVTYSLPNFAMIDLQYRLTNINKFTCTV